MTTAQSAGAKHELIVDTLTISMCRTIGSSNALSVEESVTTVGMIAQLAVVKVKWNAALRSA